MNPLLKLVLMAAVIVICSKAGAQVQMDNAMLSGVKIGLDTSRFIFDFGTQTITGYTGLVNGHLVVPQRIGGVQVLHLADAVGDAGFYGKDVKSVSLPSGLLTIGFLVFFNPNATQTDLVIPSSVTLIGESAFYGWPLTKITIGSNVTLGAFSIGSKGDTDTFKAFYDAGGKLAGTYNFDGENWTKE